MASPLPCLEIMSQVHRLREPSSSCCSATAARRGLVNLLWRRGARCLELFRKHTGDSQALAVELSRRFTSLLSSVLMAILFELRRNGELGERVSPLLGFMAKRLAK